MNIWTSVPVGGKWLRRSFEKGVVERSQSEWQSSKIIVMYICQGRRGLKLPPNHNETNQRRTDALFIIALYCNTYFVLPTLQQTRWPSWFSGTKRRLQQRCKDKRKESVRSQGVDFFAHCQYDKLSEHNCLWDWWWGSGAELRDIE